jgi:hypothetical protein
MKGYRFLKGLMFAAVAVLFAGLVVFALMTSWNYVMPAVFNLPMLTFWHALALIIVAKILLFNGWRRGGGHWGHHQHWRQRWGQRMANMSPEEKARVKQYWENKCGKRFGGWHETATENTGETGV